MVDGLKERVRATRLLIQSPARTGYALIGIYRISAGQTACYMPYKTVVLLDSLHTFMMTTRRSVLSCCGLQSIIQSQRSVDDNSDYDRLFQVQCQCEVTAFKSVLILILITCMHCVLKSSSK